MRNFTIGLIGNPNTGKTTLFNKLTGSHQRVGNWPGVTVDKKSGFFYLNDIFVEIIDLPGIYSLSASSKEGALDESISIEYIISNTPDLILNVLDASNLERNLYLTTQLLELNVPIVLAVNMVDFAEKHGIFVDCKKLSEVFNCSVVPIIALKNKGIDELKRTVISYLKSDSLHNQKHIEFSYPVIIQKFIDSITKKIEHPYRYFIAVKLLESDQLVENYVKKKYEILPFVEKKKEEILHALDEDLDIIIADTKYSFIHDVVAKSVNEKSHIKRTITSKIDAVVLNRILGIPIFFAVMYLMFVFTIDVGGYFQNFFQVGAKLVFVNYFQHLLFNFHLPLWLVSILVAGLGRGLTTTITFVPILATMFVFLSLLETTGYMARAGFVIDRLMTSIGLPGKSFVPLIIGFGCNVPAIMAARTLENQRDRTLTVLMTPFMSCGARFAVYAIFIAAFFPRGGQNIVFVLYVIGILIAVLTGLLLRKTVLKGQQSMLIAEMPPYHIPNIKDVSIQTWVRLKSFIIKAGKFIVPICLLLSVLNTVHIGRDSVLARVGKGITPIFKPMGIKENNWPATVGLITGVVAKEVVIGTLNTLYAETAAKHVLKSKIKGHKSIYRNSVYGQMYKKFSGKRGAFVYLLFVLLYFPCVPAVIAIFRELNFRWASFSMLWNTGVAYCVATACFKIFEFRENPFSSIFTIGVIVSMLAFTILVMKRVSNKKY